MSFRFWRWFCCCWFIVLCTSHRLWNFCVWFRFVKHYLVSFLVLQSSRRGREGWLLCINCLPDVLLVFCGSSSQCHKLVCSMWLWYFLIILTNFYDYRSDVRPKLQAPVHWQLDVYWRQFVAVEGGCIVNKVEVKHLVKICLCHRLPCKFPYTPYKRIYTYPILTIICNVNCELLTLDR